MAFTDEKQKSTFLASGRRNRSFSDPVSLLHFQKRRMKEATGGRGWHARFEKLPAVEGTVTKLLICCSNEKSPKHNTARRIYLHSTFRLPNKTLIGPTNDVTFDMNSIKEGLSLFLDEITPATPLLTLEISGALLSNHIPSPLTLLEDIVKTQLDQIS